MAIKRHDVMAPISPEASTLLGKEGTSWAQHGSGWQRMAADGSGWQRMAMKTSTIPLFWYSNALRYLRYPLQKEITW